MSELIEKVEKVLARTTSDFFSLPADLPQAHLHKAQAVAAIAAVAEWMIDEFGYQAEMIEVKEAISAALRAAGEKVGTHGTPELDEDARKLEAMGQDPGATFVTDPAPVCEWKPIETAPKDGTEFIVFRDDAGVFAARYVEPSNDDGEMFLASMYGEDLTGDMMPTHWMPLPPPPEAKD